MGIVIGALFTTVYQSFYEQLQGGGMLTTWWEVIIKMKDIERGYAKRDKCRFKKSLLSCSIFATNKFKNGHFHVRRTPSDKVELVYGSSSRKLTRVGQKVFGMGGTTQLELFDYLKDVEKGENACQTLLNIVALISEKKEILPQPELEKLIDEYRTNQRAEIEKLIANAYSVAFDEHDADVAVPPSSARGATSVKKRSKRRPKPQTVGKDHKKEPLKRPRSDHTQLATPCISSMAAGLPTIKIDETVKKPYEDGGILFLPAKLASSRVCNVCTDDADVTP